MQEMDEPTLVQRFGPNAGLAVGIGKGALDRYLLGLGFRGLARTRTDRANALMGEMGKGDVNQRVGRLNQYYSEGRVSKPAVPIHAGSIPLPVGTRARWTACRRVVSVHTARS